jgi:DNA-binding transcriptional LysR family regulator
MRYLLPLRYIDAIARAGSIRKAAETLAITSTALNRRVLAMEEELGAPIFERLPRGVRLSAAGEILLHHIRAQLSDMERVKSQIADLAGERRGHVSIACSQALLPYFLPEQIAAYRNVHPAVTFGVHLRDRAAAEKALGDLSADLALVFEPVRLADLQILLTVRQAVHAIMRANHPLAQQTTVRLRDCLRFPVALPTAPYGVRSLLELAVQRTSLRLQPAIESDSFEFLRHQALAEDLITFQIAIGLPVNSHFQGLVSPRIDERDVPPGILYVSQLRGRALPVAAARFANQMLGAFAERFDCN